MAAAQAGATTALIARVGRDLFGQQLRQGLHAKDVDTTHLSEDSLHPTGASTVLTGGDGDYASIVVPGAAGNLGVREINDAAAMIARYAVLLLQLEIPFEPSVAAATIAKSSNMGTDPVVVLNAAPAASAASVIAKFGGQVDMVVVNSVEAGMLVEMPVSDPATGITAAEGVRGRLGVETVIVTLGSVGAVVCYPHGSSFHPALPVEVVDTIGAGDAFVGALAAELARGAGLDVALPFASAAGALAVTRAGAYDALPARRAILRLLEA